MPETTDDPNQSYESQQLAEDIATGDAKAAEVNVEADYEASKSFSTSDIDEGEAGAEAAETATASKFNLSEPGEVEHEAKSTSNPDDYREMAKDVNPQITE